MSKSPTNLSLDTDAKQACIQLFSDLGMDLSTAVNMFLKKCIQVRGIPFIISADKPNAETIAAMNEYYMMKQHPENYKRYASFKEAMNEVLADDT